MACSGCDARRQWLKRKAKLMAQAIAAALKQQKTDDPKTHGQPTTPSTDNPAQ